MYLWGFFKTFTILCAYVICLWLVITGLYVAVHMIVSKIRRRNEQETKRKFQKLQAVLHEQVTNRKVKPSRVKIIQNIEKNGHLVKLKSEEHGIVIEIKIGLEDDE